MSDNQPCIAEAIRQFHSTYKKRFTYQLDTGVQIVNFHLVAKVAVQKPELAKKAKMSNSVEQCILHRRIVDFDQHGIHEATIYDGLMLEPDMELSGPAVIQEPSATLVIAPPHRVSVDDYGNYHVAINHVAINAA